MTNNSIRQNLSDYALPIAVAVATVCIGIFLKRAVEYFMGKTQARAKDGNQTTLIPNPDSTGRIKRGGNAAFYLTLEQRLDKELAESNERVLIRIPKNEPQALIDLINNPNCAEKLDKIISIEFSFSICPHNDKQKKVIQELFDMLSDNKLPNLKSLHFANIFCGDYEIGTGTSFNERKRTRMPSPYSPITNRTESPFFSGVFEIKKVNNGEIVPHLLPSGLVPHFAFGNIILFFRKIQSLESISFGNVVCIDNLESFKKEKEKHDHATRLDSYVAYAHQYPSRQDTYGVETIEDCEQNLRKTAR